MKKKERKKVEVVNSKFEPQNFSLQPTAVGELAFDKRATRTAGLFGLALY